MANEIHTYNTYINSSAHQELLEHMDQKLKKSKTATM